MLFEREEDALQWYESQERVITPAFLSAIPWQDVKKYALDSAFIPVMKYMRDVEAFTSVYFDELAKTPTIKNPSIRRFMERWRTEEPTHADLLERFMGEAGVPTDDRWLVKSLKNIPRSYRLSSRFSTFATRPFGEHFSAVHMTWGAINELTTLTGYTRLSRLAKHPVLEHILRAIAQEEARHSLFYWSVARIKLANSSFRQRLARFIVRKFWSPVGTGAKPVSDSNMVIRALFSGQEGVNAIERHVTQRIEQLPGFSGLKTVTDRIARVA